MTIARTLLSAYTEFSTQFGGQWHTSFQYLALLRAVNIQTEAFK
jgi:hypothetical protein